MLNIIFFAFGKIGTGQFWFIIVICAVMGYWGVPFMRRSLLGDEREVKQENINEEEIKEESKEEDQKK